MERLTSEHFLSLTRKTGHCSLCILQTASAMARCYEVQTLLKRADVRLGKVYHFRTLATQSDEVPWTKWISVLGVTRSPQPAVPTPTRYWIRGSAKVMPQDDCEDEGEDDLTEEHMITQQLVRPATSPCRSCLVCGEDNRGGRKRTRCLIRSFHLPRLWLI